MRIANDHLILDIDDATGALRGLYNGRRQFLSPGERPRVLLRLRDAAGAAIDVCSDRFTRIRVSYYNGLNGERAVLMDYSGYPDLDLRVAARVTLAEGDTQSRWSLSLDNGTGCLLEWLDTPSFGFPTISPASAAICGCFGPAPRGRSSPTLPCGSAANTIPTSPWSSPPAAGPASIPAPWACK